jgi:hypothetical protein
MPYLAAREPLRWFDCVETYHPNKDGQDPSILLRLHLISLLTFVVIRFATVVSRCD